MQIHKVILQIHNKRKDNPIDKCAKDLNRNFSDTAGGNIKWKNY